MGPTQQVPMPVLELVLEVAAPVVLVQVVVVPLLLVEPVVAEAP